MYVSVSMIGKPIRVTRAVKYGGRTVGVWIEAADGAILDLHLPAEFYAELAEAAANAEPDQRPAS